MEFSEIYSEYDQQEEKKLRHKRALEEKLETHYLTFYERLLGFLDIHPLAFCIFFSLLLFALHLTAAIFEPGATSHTIIEDFSYFLALLNGAGLYLVISATDKLRDFIVNLIQLAKNGATTASDQFLNMYQSDFLGKRTLYFGLFFGTINSLLSIVFGVGYLERGEYLLLGTFLFQTFAIGFIGGITVNATTIVIRLIRIISIKDDIHLTYFYPDKCAGTLVIGNILFLFSVHFILIGVLIFLFIHNFNWTHQIPGNYYVNALILLWKIFPFLLSAVIFFLPVKKINRILAEYKLFEQMRIRKRMHYLSDVIMSLESDRETSREKIEILDNHYQKLVKIDEQIGELNTWPYNLQYRAAFLSIFLPVAIGVILELSIKVVSRFL